MRAASQPQRDLITHIADRVAETGGPVALESWELAAFEMPNATLRACERRGWIESTDDQPPLWDVLSAGYAEIGRKPVDVAALQAELAAVTAERDQLLAAAGRCEALGCALRECAR